MKLSQQARERGRKDTGCRKCLACTKIFALSLINNSRMNSELTKQEGMAFTEARCGESAIQSL